MTSSDARTRIALAVVAVALAGGQARAQRTAADVETARELYNAARKLEEAGDLRGALEKFKAAHALGKTPITGLELARTYAALGQPVEAREICLGIARMPVTPEETARSTEARNEAARLAEEVKPKIATMRLHLKGVPQGGEATVIIDGVTLPSASLGQPRQANPGVHTVVARVGNGPETRASTELKPGQAHDVDIVLVPPREPAPTSSARAPEPREQRLSPLVIPGFAVAAVGLGVGTVTGILALSAKNDLTSSCVASRCGPDQYGTLDRGRTMGTVSTIAFIVGGAGAAVGIWGLTHPWTATPRTGFVQPYVTAGSAGIHGAF
jgi:hypothetical protein